MTRCPGLLLRSVLALAACGTPAAARTLAVGPGLEFAAPSEAARVAGAPPKSVSTHVTIRSQAAKVFIDSRSGKPRVVEVAGHRLWTLVA